MSTAMKYRKQIDNLRNKLERQLQAAEETRDLIAALEQLELGEISGESRKRPADKGRP